MAKPLAGEMVVANFRRGEELAGTRGEAPFSHSAARDVGAYPSARLFILRRLGGRRSFGRLAFSLALCGLLVLSSLLFVAAGARRPVALAAVSIVIGPERHGILT
jgi:hypothetical protein